MYFVGRTTCTAMFSDKPGTKRACTVALFILKFGMTGYSDDSQLESYSRSLNVISPDCRIYPTPVLFRHRGHADNQIREGKLFATAIII